jgi:transcriptional regulator with XRE-family HTH domain
MADFNVLGERLRELRKRAGMTQEELAGCIDVHLNTISRWENGIDTPKTLKIKRLAEALGCTESELLNGPSDGKVKLTLVYDWGQMKEGKIDMNGNEFELILGSQGQIGLKGAGLITSAEAIEEFLGKVKEQLTIALDAQIRRGAIPQAE